MPTATRSDTGSGASVDAFMASADDDGPEALPRRNGELVFQEPWESRAFGVAVALAREHAYEWEDFRRRLIEEIGGWERQGEDPATWSYYERWLASLERLVTERGMVTDDELRRRMDRIAHEEAHEHKHDHHHDAHEGPRR